MKNTKKFAAMIAALTLSACSVAPMFSFATELSEEGKTAYNNYVTEYGNISVDDWLELDGNGQYKPTDDNSGNPEDSGNQPGTTETEVTLEAGKIKFNKETAGTHSYSVYKIFAGTAEANGMNPATGAKLNDITWATGVSAEVQNVLVSELKAKGTAFEVGIDVNGAAVTTVNAFDSLPTTDISAVDFSAAVSKLDSTQAKVFADTVVRVFKKNSVTAIATGTGTGIELTEDGYYVIAETGITGAGAGEYEGMTTYLLGVYDASAGAVVNVKSDVPSFQKKLKDINDSNGEGETDWQDSADYDIGDKVPFQLKATLPSNYNEYKAYKLAFHDNFRNVDGKEVFDFDEITALYVDANNNGVYDDDEVDLSGKYSNTNSAVTGYDFDVIIDDLKADFKEMGNTGAAVIVEYTAILNENAVIGSAGNWNDAYLSYTTNPNWNGDGDKEEEEHPKDSPVDTTVVFTYQTNIDKVNPQGTPLTGATFALAKKYKTAPVGGTVLTVGTGDKTVTYDGYYTVDTIIADDKTSIFEFKGIDDGDYILVEIEAPKNYKIATKPVYFTIEATHTNDPATLELTSLSGAGTEGDLDDGFINLREVKDSTEKMIADKTAGTITAGFINTSGAELPSTGGIGTTIFYLGGGAMVAVAGVFLITKKRMGKSEN